MIDFTYCGIILIYSERTPTMPWLAEYIFEKKEGIVLSDPIHLQDDVISLRLSRTLSDGHPSVGNVPVYLFSIILKENHRMIGQCNLQLGHDDKMLYMGNLGYGIWEEYRGHRYSLRAARILADYAWSQGMTELYITTDVNNYASQRICELLGAERIAVLDVPESHSEYKKGSYRKYRYVLRKEATTIM